MKLKYCLLVFVILTFPVFSQTHSLQKTNDDVFSKYTDIGAIRLTVTNFGTYGSGLKNLSNPNHQPSCEYPAGSGIEHIYSGGLWIGGYKRMPGTNYTSGPYVTTGAIDASTLANGRNAGFEFTNALSDSIKRKSNLIASPFYAPDAVSPQDFIMDFCDTNYTYLDGTTISDHTPLGVAVHLETYCWDVSQADNFVIFNYTIKNVNKTGYLDSLYIGLWTDAVVRNTLRTTTVNTNFMSHGGEGFADTLQMGYEFDADGDPGYTDNYIGVQYLGSTPEVKPAGIIPPTNFTSWMHNNATDPNYFTPQNDSDCYKRMQGYFGGASRYNNGIDPLTLKTPSNRSFLLSHGGYSNIAPGDSINIAFAIVCAKKYGTEAAANDTREQKKNLFASADMALTGYYGTDLNRNGIVDAGEDIYGSGKIVRYVFVRPVITSPEEGNKLVAGTIRNIQWKFGANTVTIELSTDGGSTWSVVVNSLPASEGTYAWTVPDINSSNCFIKISDAANAAGFSISKKFSITSKNAAPEISWGAGQTLPDTTLPVMTYTWEVSDPNGNETISAVQLALNDTSNFASLAPTVSKITVRTKDFSNVSPSMDILINSDPSRVAAAKLNGLKLNENNILFLRAVDNDGAVSPWLSTTGLNTSGKWFVKKPKGGILIIDDYSIAGDDAAATKFYNAVMDSIGMQDKFDVCDIKSGKMPYINETLFETVKLFGSVLWYSDYDTPSLELARTESKKYTASGGKIFFSMQMPVTIDSTQIADFLPILPDSTAYKSYMLKNMKISAAVNDTSYPDLTASATVYRVRAFYLKSAVSDPLYYFPNSELRGNIGFKTKDNSLFFVGLPLHLMNATPGSVSKLLKKVFLSDFNTPGIAITSPLAGQECPAGSTFNIQWICSGIANVNIEYSTDGIHWTSVVSNYPATSGYYSWLVPHTTASIILKISDVQNALISAVNSGLIITNVKSSESKKDLTYCLYQNYPNPFNPTTTIAYEIPKDGLVMIKVFDILGNVVGVPVNEYKRAGNYHVSFGGSHLPSGVYFYRISTAGFTKTNKMMLLK